MNLESKETREIFTDKSLKPYGIFSWALDNSGFYVPVSYSTHPKYVMASVMKLYRYDIDTHRYREIDLGWDKFGGRFEVTQDGFVMGLPDGVHFKYARYYKKGNTWKRQWIKGDTQKNIASIKINEDSKTMIYSFSTASQPERYYLARLKGDRFIKKNEVMDIKSPLFKKPLTKSEIIRWKGAMENTVEGILYYPYKYEKGKKYPLIVMIHGGPNGADMDFFRDRLAYPAHLMSERGAFSLKVNYHGSSNYGIEFGESIAGHYYEYEVPDIEKGVDTLIAQGKVDEEKLGIIGWSNGAILGTALTIHTRRYKAVSLGAGDVNWTSDYGNCAFGVAFDNYYFGGPPWERVEHYIKKSPLFQLYKVTTPTLIFHGSSDRAVPYEQGWEYYRALKVIGKAPVRFISFPGEGHGPKKLAHQRRKLSEEIEWFEKYLFKTHKDKNEAKKKGSPLDLLPEFQKISKVKGAMGLEKEGKLIPEVLEYKKIIVGRFEVTRAQWACFDQNYKFDKGTENIPVTGIAFAEAVKYCLWLSKLTGETYRLPKKEDIKTLYEKRSGNTFDYWAGYTLSPGDYKSLLKELKKFGDKPVLLKPVGSFKPAGKELIFDLDGNAAEWVEIEAEKGKACGGSAERPEDDKSLVKAHPGYTGFRVIKKKK
jgi:pimeloyl-ACP methyl ester carboxylesterase